MSSINAYLGRKFSHQGLAGRLEFFRTWIGGFIFALVWVAPVFYFAMDYINDVLDYGASAASILSDEEEDLLVFGLVLWQYLGSVLGFAYSVAIFMTVCRRLADMGSSKWWVLICALPLINIVFLFVLLFKNGELSRRAKAEGAPA